MFVEKSFGACKVFRRIDADSLNIGESYLDTIAVLQPSQLLQTLCFFQRALGQFCYLCQNLAALGVKSQMLEEGEMCEPVTRLLAAYEGNDASAKIESIASHVADNLR